MTEEHKRITITIDVEDDPCTEVLAVQALLRLVEWLQHEGTFSARTTLKITTP